MVCVGDRSRVEGVCLGDDWIVIQIERDPDLRDYRAGIAVARVSLRSGRAPRQKEERASELFTPARRENGLASDTNMRGFLRPTARTDGQHKINDCQT